MRSLWLWRSLPPGDTACISRADNGSASKELYREDAKAPYLWLYNGSILGPEIRLKAGERVKVRLKNNRERLYVRRVKLKIKAVIAVGPVISAQCSHFCICWCWMLLASSFKTFAALKPDHE
ncbi:multicopper oxidase domain-containing protein [Roseibium sp.]|uniref:multicopper oxidase domain-containing protein n=1 Tax=Roseibium sp. TaxID=1936156 RepID=UPI003B5261BD